MLRCFMSKFLSLSVWVCNQFFMTKNLDRSHMTNQMRDLGYREVYTSSTPSKCMSLCLLGHCMCYMRIWGFISKFYEVIFKKEASLHVIQHGKWLRIPWQVCKFHQMLFFDSTRYEVNSWNFYISIFPLNNK